MSFGLKITSNWYSEFTMVYCHAENIHYIKQISRVQHLIIELQNQGFM